MAQFDFYGDWEDSIVILKELFHLNGLTLILNKYYQEPNPIILKQLDDDVLLLLKNKPRMLIWSDLFSIFPPQFFKFKDGDMMIQINESGPGFELELCRSSEKSDKLRLIPGMLFRPPQFYHPVSKTPYKLSDDILIEYSKIKQTICHSLEKRYFASQKITINGKITPIAEPIWIGKHGLTLIESDTAFINIYRRNIGKEDIKKHKDDVMLIDS